MNDTETTRTRAMAAFKRRDELEREMRAIDAELQALRSEHMRASGLWGLRMDAFRNDVFTIKVAA